MVGHGSENIPHSKKAPLAIAVQVIFPSALFSSRYFLAEILGTNTASVLAFSFVTSEPNSEAINRFTPALIAASTRRLLPPKANDEIADTTASWPLKAAVRESMDSKSAVVARVPGGRILPDFEASRVRTVTLNCPLSWRALRMEGPRFPVACVEC